MCKPSEMERVIRGLERCGYHLYAVAVAGSLHGYMTLLPTIDEEQRATLRTIGKWQRKWRIISVQEHARTIAEHLHRTGRTEVATQAKRQMMRGNLHLLG